MFIHLLKTNQYIIAFVDSNGCLNVVGGIAAD